MLKRLIVLAALVLLVLLALPALSADQPKAVAAQPQAQALSTQHAAMLAKLRALPPADAKLTLSAAAIQGLKLSSVRKEVSCGIYLSPPNPNPTAISPRLYFVNSTGQSLPAGVKIDWEVEGVPGTCCKGTGYATVNWAPNPPSPVFLATAGIVYPPQPWTRPCKAWVTMP